MEEEERKAWRLGSSSEQEKWQGRRRGFKAALLPARNTAEQASQGGEAVMGGGGERSLVHRGPDRSSEGLSALRKKVLQSCGPSVRHVPIGPRTS